MDDWYWLASIVEKTWSVTEGRRRKTLAATVAATLLLLALWFLLLMLTPSSGPDPGGWLVWLPLVLGVAMWPVAVVIAFRLVRLDGVGPRLVVTVGSLMLSVLLVGLFLIAMLG